MAGEGSARAGVGFAGLLAQIGSEGFHGAALRAKGSYIAANWPNPDLAALKAMLRMQILAADPGGSTATDIEDRAGDRHLDGLIAWVVRQEEANHAALLAAAPPPVLPTYPDRGVPLDVAQEHTAAVVQGFAEELRRRGKPELM